MSVVHIYINFFPYYFLPSGWRGDFVRINYFPDEFVARITLLPFSVSLDPLELNAFV